MENEVICEHCHGTGLEINDNVYGIQGDTTHIGVHFPYKHQSLTFCKHCYKGVRLKCNICGGLVDRLYTKCQCDADKVRHEKCKNENNERWEKASKISLAEAWEKYECLYVDNLDAYVFSQDDLEEILEEAELDKSLLDKSLLRIYGTKSDSIKMDASNIIENACNDLHEDAIDQCNEESLQKLLDEWCKKQTGTTTYYPDYTIGIVIGGLE